jgi:acetylcholinesterase
VREDDWQSFVRAIPACATNATSGAFACLQKADLNSSALALATATAAAQPDELYPFVPNYDGVGGVYPAPGSIILATGHWAKQVPFITGCNLDEGTAFTSMRMAGDSVEAALLSNFTPSLIPLFGKQLLQYNTEQLLELYPNDPALGAPFGTGNNTFGLDASFKQYAALCELVYTCSKTTS